jgi:hypothetical protein
MQVGGHYEIMVSNTNDFCRRETNKVSLPLLFELPYVLRVRVFADT